MAWISTRRAAPAADTIAGQLIGRYHLADVLASKDAPLTEMIAADVVMIELPPVMKLRFEHQVLDMVAKLQAASLEIVLMVSRASGENRASRPGCYDGTSWHRHRSSLFRNARASLEM